ncbi:hypothetical protein M409DRAFT_70900 [Zasmidium cellare ATCC 36951]|uniref:Cytochrome P450 n=1 Tax=Zasmidium cellare ATCC 36951 TaxID=1080233 RepID=A0A6A6BXQ3_ZASCE|nr:uncharacterized protein M409DRAFT_70900 [Zasmidium cellare ATCC 36951]KAF2159577.1 hypothetical protein M409DRAFT_70900 [Zasmidium cellare ATCC 36951]
MEQYKVSGSKTFTVRSWNNKSIFTGEPANTQAIHTNLEDWTQAAERRIVTPFSRSNIINQDGAAWRHSRDLINPLFKRAELDDVERFKKFVDRMITLIPRDESTVDMHPLLRKLFLDSSSEFCFGESIDSLRDRTGQADAFIAAFNRATTGDGKRIHPTRTFRKLMFKYTKDDEWMADVKIVHDYIDRCIARHRDTNADMTAKQRKGYFILKGMSKDVSDPVELRFQLLGIFSTARELTAMAFANTLFLLARQPDLWQELRAEAQGLGGKAPTSFEELKSIPLFRYTIMEALRVRSPIVLTRRQAARDTVLPRGGGPDGSSPVLIPKGSMVWCDKYANTRETTTWGPDLDTFRPSRFEGKKLGWEFTPFSGGPRICPANQQVISQCVYLLLRLVQEFESIENRDPVFGFKETLMMCIESRNGCEIALHPNNGV